MALILIVDDSLTVRMDLSEAFENAGHTTVLSATVTAAREAVRNQKIDLIVLDVVLPDGDGVELLHELRENPATAEIPIILLSTKSEVASRIRGLSTGANDYVGKPYERHYLVVKTAQLLKQTIPASARSSLSILVIDDSPTFREELKEALQS